jgi:predicted Zn-dependent protease
LLTVYAEAFDRDDDPDDFSLEAILAHERGHQLLARHPRIAKRVAGRLSAASEEILASLLGAMICSAETDRDALLAKATVELLNHGETLEVATRRLQDLWDLLEALL